VFQLHHLLLAGFDEREHRVLVAQPVAAGEGVVEVLVRRIVAADDAAKPPSAALSRHRVAAHGHHLRDQRDAQAAVGFMRSNGGPQASTARFATSTSQSMTTIASVLKLMSWLHGHHSHDRDPRLVPLWTLGAAMDAAALSSRELGRFLQ